MFKINSVVYKLCHRCTMGQNKIIYFELKLNFTENSKLCCATRLTLFFLWRGYYSSQDFLPPSDTINCQTGTNKGIINNTGIWILAFNYISDIKKHYFTKKNNKKHFTSYKSCLLYDLTVSTHSSRGIHGSCSLLDALGYF